VDTLDCTHELCPDSLIFTQGHEHNEILVDGDEMRRERTRKLKTVGTLNNLVVLMRFTDHTSRNLPSRQAMNILFNGDQNDCNNNQAICGESGSVQSYYKKFTHGQLTITSHVQDWVTVPYTEAEAADGRWG
jgi:hypothetical protein